MLRARASAALARAVYPDFVGGLYDPDELGAPEPRDVTPARTPVPEARAVEPADEPPAAVPAAIEPSPEPAVAAPVAAANPEFVRLAQMLSAAASRVERLDAGAAVRAAHAAGKITDAEREELRAAYAASASGAK